MKYEDFEKRELQYAFCYKEGKLFWKKPNEDRHDYLDPIDDYAGYHTRDGYYRVQLGGNEYMGARVIWLLHHGEWPQGRLRYVDGNNRNTAIENLEIRK